MTGMTAMTAMTAMIAMIVMNTMIMMIMIRSGIGSPVVGSWSLPAFEPLSPMIGPPALAGRGDFMMKIIALMMMMMMMMVILYIW